MPRVGRLPLQLDPSALHELADELVTGTNSTYLRVALKFVDCLLQRSLPRELTAHHWGDAVEHFLVRHEDLCLDEAEQARKKEVATPSALGACLLGVVMYQRDCAYGGCRQCGRSWCICSPTWRHRCAPATSFCSGWSMARASCLSCAAGALVFLGLRFGIHMKAHSM